MRINVFEVGTFRDLIKILNFWSQALKREAQKFSVPGCHLIGKSRDILRRSQDRRLSGAEVCPRRVMRAEKDPSKL